MTDGTTRVEDEDIVTTWREDAKGPGSAPTATVADPQDADGTDGDSADGTDGDGTDGDGTDGTDGDSGGDADGTDSGEGGGFGGDGTRTPHRQHPPPDRAVPLSDLADPGKIFGQFAAGATIVLQGLQRFWAPLAAFSRGLELFLTHPIQVNAYLTPPASRGLGVHHDARTAQDASLHLTVGMLTYNWNDLLGEVVEQATEEIWFREGLPVGFAEDPAALEAALGERVAELRRFLDKVDLGRAAERAVNRFWAG